MQRPRRRRCLAALALTVAVAGQCATVRPAAAPPLRAPARRSLVLGPLAALALAASPEAAPAEEGGGGADLRGWAAAASGALQGVAQNVVKQAILHPFDTVKTRVQVSSDAPGAGLVERGELFRDLYRGILPCLLSSTPGSAVFFAAKEAVSNELIALGAPTPLPTLGGVAAGVLSAKAVRTPFDVAETKAMAAAPEAGCAARPLGWDGSWSAARAVLETEGPLGLYRGYGANVALKLPQDAAKFVCYEALRSSGTLPPGVAGAAAALTANAVTNPLDVLRTRVMVEGDRRGEGNMAGAFNRIASSGDYQQLWAGLDWRLARGILAGAIQFSVLESTKSAVSGR